MKVEVAGPGAVPNKPIVSVDVKQLSTNRASAYTLALGLRSAPQLVMM